jgi:hypothetical protein
MQILPPTPSHECSTHDYFPAKIPTRHGTWTKNPASEPVCDQNTDNGEFYDEFSHSERLVTDVLISEKCGDQTLSLIEFLPVGTWVMGTLAITVLPPILA